MLHLTIKANSIEELMMQLNAALSSLRAPSDYIAPKSITTTSTKVHITEILKGEPTPVEEGIEVTYGLESDVIPAMRNFVKRNGRPAALALLKEYGAASTKEVKPEHYKDLMAAIA